MAIAACDSSPPTATLYEPNARWLHDKITVEIDESIDGRWGYSGSSLYANGERVATGSGLSWNDSASWASVTVPRTLGSRVRSASR